MNTETEEKILNELEKQTAFGKKSLRSSYFALLILLVFVATIPFRHQLYSKHSTPDSWGQAKNLIRQGSTEQGKKMIERLLKKFPDYDYGYVLMGWAERMNGDFEAAEKNYAKAVELYPREENQNALEAIRQAIKNRSEPIK